MNKKGYTLIEVLVVIALISIVSVTIINSVTNMNEKTNKSLYDSKVTMALNSLEEMGNDIIDTLDSNCTVVTIDELIKNNYLNGDDETKDILIDPTNEESMNDKKLCVSYINNKVKVYDYNENIIKYTINVYVHYNSSIIYSIEKGILNENNKTDITLPYNELYDYSKTTVTCEKDVSYLEVNNLYDSLYYLNIKGITSDNNCYVRLFKNDEVLGLND